LSNRFSYKEHRQLELETFLSPLSFQAVFAGEDQGLDLFGKRKRLALVSLVGFTGQPCYTDTIEQQLAICLDHNVVQSEPDLIT
jgi:hypothetical protein